MVPSAIPASLLKCPTGIQGLNEIERGGLTFRRAALARGGAGCDETFRRFELLVDVAMQHNAPGTFLGLDATAKELAQDVRSVDFDLEDLLDDVTEKSQPEAACIRIERRLPDGW